jgi:hypothetical protein
MPEKYKHSLIFTAIFAAVMLQAVFSPHAAYEDFKPSSATDVGIAFYKLANSVPDFNSWIRRSEDYARADTARKTRLLSDGVKNLRRRFSSYDINEEKLVISVPGKVWFEEADPAEDHDYDMRLIFAEENIDYFPYKIGDNIIAVIIKDLQKHMKHSLNKPDFIRVLNSEEYDFSSGAKQRVQIRFMLKPVSADTRKPVRIKGHEVWLMLAEPASVSLWNKDRFLWESQSYWYESPTETEIRRLFRE